MDIRDEVKDYFTLDKEIKESSSLLTDLRKKRKAAGDTILEWMQQNDKSRIKTKHGVLERSVQTRKVTVNAAYVQECATNFLNDEEMAANLCKIVYENRPSVEKEIVKTVKNSGDQTEALAIADL